MFGSLKYDNFLLQIDVFIEAEGGHVNQLLMGVRIVHPSLVVL